MQAFPKNSPPAKDRWRLNRAHWSATTDARNLKGGAGRSGEELLRQAELYDTADVRAALDALEPLDGALVLDLGGGNALAALLLARRGARVVICDLAVPRLIEARAALAQAAPELEGRILFVAGGAENLPFASATLDRAYTKSVLIHTRLAEAAAELGRILAPGAKAAFIEPQRRNPFVNAYRALLAPKIWKDITTYFSSAEWQTLSEGLGGGFRTRRLAFYWLGFFAAAFQFALPNPGLARLLEKAFLILDKPLLRLGWVRRQAWFGILVAEKSGGEAGSCPPEGETATAP